VEESSVSVMCHVCYRTEVLVTLTTDVGKLLSKLNQVRPKGNISFVSAIRIAHVSYVTNLPSSVTDKLCRKKPKHSKAQSTMPASRDVRDKP